MGHLAVTVLHEAARQIQEEDFSIEELPDGFNTSFLCCLPKKPTGTDPTAGDYFAPSSTRPLSLVNTDNRLIASSFRVLLEPLIEPLISKAQRGFLRGRQMLSNILDIDFESMKISLLHDKGALILFDFEAAFPSVSQSFMMEMLHLLGLPGNIVKVASALYHKCSCLIKVHGSSFDGFEMTSGVRQGCPLSPLLFVFVVDILLRHLEAITKGRDLVRAFADDIGMVVQGTRLTLSAIFEAFGKFARFSGLNLNFKKTICIPLWADTTKNIRDDMSLLHEACRDIAYDDHGTYLGFTVGPGRCRSQWHKASDKFLQRAITWRAAGQGLHHACTAYNTFVVTVLSHLWQLTPPHPELLRLEKLALARLLPGPGNWTQPCDLWMLQLTWVFSNKMISIHYKSLAAAVRVCLTTAPDFRKVARELRQAMDSTSQPFVRALWSGWYASSFYFHLTESYDEFRRRNIHPTHILAKLRNEQRNRGGTSYPLNKPHMVEGTLYNAILANSLEGKEHPIRRTRLFLTRWNHSATEVDALRIQRYSRIIGQFTLPTIHAAVLRTWRNAWITDRRMRTCNSTAKHKCVFGCLGQAADSIEHYAYCSSIRHAGRSLLSTAAPEDAIPCGIKTTILMEGCNNKQDIIFRAIWLGLLYSAYNAVKHSEGDHTTDSPSKGELCDLLRDKLQEYKGHCTQHCWFNW